MKPIGACVIILDKENNVLILKRSSVSYWMPNKWGLPGGKIEEGETAEQTAIRETREETQLQIKNLFLIVADKKVAVFCSRKFSGNIQIDFEHSDWAWAKGHELTNYDGIPHLAALYERALDYDKKENHQKRD